MSVHTHRQHFDDETNVPTISATGAKRRQRKAPSALATSVTATLERSGKWEKWQEIEPRLAPFDHLEEVREAWRRRDERCYQVVTALTALGSRRGGDDDDAALAVTVLLEDGVNRVAMALSDVCSLDDVNATVWEEVKRAEPQLGCHAAHYLLRRAHQRLSRAAAGMISRIETRSLQAVLSEHGARVIGGGEDRDRDDCNLLIAVPEVEDPVEDLVDLLAWATGAGVIGAEDVNLLVEMLAAENAGLGREEAQQLVGVRHGVGMRTIRRRTTRATQQLREAAPRYLAAIA